MPFALCKVIKVERSNAPGRYYWTSAMARHTRDFRNYIQFQDGTPTPAWCLVRYENAAAAAADDPDITIMPTNLQWSDQLGQARANAINTVLENHNITQRVTATTTFGQLVRGLWRLLVPAGATEYEEQA